MATQQELALQMIAQLRLLDPAVSADLGTPERKLLDTVGQSLSDGQIDLAALGKALDLDSKYGENLDRFLVLFGFRRLAATYSTGFATFGRVSASDNDIRIPAGTQVKALIDDTSTIEATGDTVFSTTFDVTLPAGDLTVVAPIRANLPGASGNVDTNTVTQFVGTTLLGITSVTNETPTTGGRDSETDEAFKVRFKTQIFRNLAGTRDQYLALAVATAFTTKANVVGSVSRYQEYIQVPPVPDSDAYDVNNDGVNEPGDGLPSEYTTALSDVPYSKYTYTEIQSFLSTGSDAFATFYRYDVDFVMNVDPTFKDRGDTHREAIVTPQLGYSVTDPRAAHQPNVTLRNVYTGVNPDIVAIRPGDVILFEHSYLSSASRNDVVNGITNAVDVFIDGGNDVAASVITTRPDSIMMFINDSTSKFHYENYRRVGEPEHRPLLGNILLPLFWEPVSDLPDQIIANEVTYLKGIHYWAIEDVSNLRGTIRARNGIEWTSGVHGLAAGDSIDDPPSAWTGAFAAKHPEGTPVPVENYLYDRNVVDLQATIDSNSQFTTDVLVHKAKIRYFKFDVSAMYAPGFTRSTVDAQARDAANKFLTSSYFGSVVQLSDVLQVIHETPGMDNVRWSTDVPGGADLARAYETDVNGQPLTNAILDLLRPGTLAQSARWLLYLTGAPTGGSILLTNLSESFTVTVTPTTSAAGLQAALRAGTGSLSITVTGTGTPDDPFLIDYGATGISDELHLTQNALTGGPKIIDADFFLTDDELPALPTGAVEGDTVPGLIIRPRAQNTFTRS